MEDDLLISSQRFSTELKSRGIAHEYSEFPGDHTWDYWDEHVREAIAFHARALGIAKTVG